MRESFEVPAGLERLSRTPLAVAIGMAVTGCDAQEARAELSPTPAVQDERGALDPLALLPLVDQLCSFPVAIGAGGQSAMSTIELAMHWTRAVPAGVVTATARAAMQEGAARLVTADVRDAGGATIATGSAWFSLGAPPGGGTDGPDPAPRPVTPCGPFQAMIGLSPEGEDGARLAPGVWEAVGWVGMPALHGGAIAAALARAAQRRIETLERGDLALASLSVRYLRAGAATGAEARAAVDAIGRRTARLSATLTVGGTAVASAQALFVAP